MAAEKYTFDDFIASVDDSHKDFVRELHDQFIENGCRIDVKAAKSGYMVSYTLDKKTVINYIFRKKGLIIRIYANHIQQYMDFLDTLPEEMEKAIQDAPVCKRLINPEACNPKCATGYDFIMKGGRYQKCRINAFMFLIRDEIKPYIKAFVVNELNACKQPA